MQTILILSCVAAEPLYSHAKIGVIKLYDEQADACTYN